MSDPRSPNTPTSPTMRSSADNYCCASRSRGHRAGHDAVLLAAATPARSGQRVVDFGAGVGAAGLALATRVRGIQLVMVEIDKDLAKLARHNAASNGIAADIFALDVAADAGVFAAAGLNPDSVDVVLMNPPFNDPARHRASPDKAREIAHVAAEDTLASWVHAARRVLKSGGVLTLIWRADGLAQVLTALDRGFRQPRDSAGSCRCRQRRRCACWFALSRAAGRHRKFTEG